MSLEAEQFTLGAMYACQFYRTMLGEIPDTEKYIEEGKFAPIKTWLNEKIHSQGTLYSPQELVQKVTGEPLNPSHFIDYLKTKYRAIYQTN